MSGVDPNSYTQTDWVDDDGSGTVGTDVTAEVMNNIEAGVEAGALQHNRNSIATALTGLTPATENNATIDTLGWSMIVTTISADADCRVRMWGSTSLRTADLARPVGTDPDPDAGLLLEVVLEAGVDLVLGPPIVLVNSKGSPAANMVSAVNPDTDTDVTVTLYGSRIE